MITIGHSEGHPVTIDPARLVSTRMLVQANSGGGKSWMLRVLCERLGRTTPLIVLDWEGEFASLREKLDVLLVGRDGEIPTAVATAGALATQVLEIGVSAVIDLYDLHPQEKRAYVRRFIESLMAAPKRLWSPRLVIVDEAHSLVPEAGQAESADAVNALMSQGRKRQFCGVLATQRLSKLHKDAAAEANNVLIGRCTLDVDQKRAGEVLGMAKADWLRLRDLTEGQFHAYGPAFNHAGVRLLKSEGVQTTHGAKPGTNAKPPEPSARMRGVVEQLRDLAERAKTEVLDLDSAKATIATLRQQLRDAARAAPDPAAVDRAREEGRAEARRGFAATIAKAVKGATELRRLASKIAADVIQFDTLADGHARSLDATAIPAPPAPQARQPTPVIIRQAPRPTSNGHARKKAEQRVLDALAQMEAIGVTEPSAAAIGLLAGIDPTGGYFSNTVGPLSTDGLVIRGAGTISLTDAGRAAANPPAAALTLSDYHAMLRSVLAKKGNKTAQMLDAILAYGGSDVTTEALAKDVAIDHSGGYFSNTIGPLGTLGLIERRQGRIRPTSLMFPPQLS